eukprot:Sspe_Gene.67452::Locus_39795_Transcript_2_3_Confidence_0.400_Length_4557::g.67452::m.67452
MPATGITWVKNVEGPIQVQPVDRSDSFEDIEEQPASPQLTADGGPQRCESAGSPGAQTLKLDITDIQPAASRRNRGAAFRFTNIDCYKDGMYQTRPSRTKESARHTSATVDVGLSSMQGWRKMMEDAHSCIVDDATVLLGVYDGHCGTEVAEKVSRELPQTIISRVSGMIVPPAAAGQVVQHVFEDIDAKLVTEHPVGGCCAVVLYIRDNRAIIANLGDTRAFLCRDGKAVPLTSDHRPVVQSEADRITAAGGKVSGKRLEVPGVQGGLSVSRAFGDHIFKQVENKGVKEQPVIPTADVTVFDLQNNDEFIVLGCDGAFEKLTDAQMVDYIKTRLNETSDLVAIAGEILDLTLADYPPGNGCDNMTMMIVRPTTSNTDADPVVETSNPNLNKTWIDMTTDGLLPPGQYRMLPEEGGINDRVLSHVMSVPELKPGSSFEKLSAWKFDTECEDTQEPAVTSSQPKDVTVDSPSRYGGRGSVCSAAILPPSGDLLPRKPAVRSLSPTSLIPTLPLLLAWTLWDAVRGAVAGAVIMALAFLTTAGVAWMWREENISTQAAQVSVFGVSLALAIVYDLLSGAVYDVWLFGLAILLLNTLPVVTRAAGLACVTGWIVLRTIDESHPFGLATWVPTGLPDAASRREGKGTFWFFGSILSRVVPMVVVSGYVQFLLTHLTESNNRAVDLKWVIKTMCSAVVTLDTSTAERLQAWCKNPEQSHLGLGSCVSQAMAATIRYRPYVPESVNLKADNDASSPESSDTENWDAESASTRSVRSNGSRRSSGEQEGRRLRTSLGAKTGWCEVTSRRATVMVGQLLVDHMDNSDASACIGGMVGAMLETCKATEAMVLHVGGNHVLLGWNTHRPCVSHGHQACISALAVQSSIFLMHPSAQWSLAVSSGQLLVGSSGNSDLKSMIAVGHPVTIAFDLGSLARMIRSRILITDLVHEQVRSQLFAKPVDVALLPRSKTLYTLDVLRPDVIYELQGERNEMNTTHYSVYVEAFSALSQLKLDTARVKFLDFLKHQPRDRHAQRLLRITAWLMGNPPAESTYFRKYVGWEDIEAASHKATLDCEVADALCKPAAAPHRPSDPLRRRESLQHDTILRRAIRDAEAEANADQLVAWGLMPGNKGTPRAASKGGFEAKTVPTKFTDHKGRTWCRAERLLGKGAFGEVFLGMGSDGILVAVKCMRLPTSRMEDNVSPTQQQSALARRRQLQRKSPSSDNRDQLQQIEDLLREVGVMHKLRHENIVSYLASAVVDGYILIVMEYLSGGSLADMLKQFGEGSIPHSCIQRYVRDIIHGLSFLHANDIIHRDMKPHNVLLLVDGQCKLADFGASAGLSNLAKTAQGVIGTPLYMSPEACKGRACKASDIWGLGIIVCQLFTGAIPYNFEEEAFNPHTFIYKLGNREDYGPSVPPSLPAEARLLASACLSREPENRPRANELESHAFLL